MKLMPLALLTLAGCSQPQPAPNKNVCAAFPVAKPYNDFRDCIQRKAYSLAKAPDQSGYIADTVVAVCEGQIQKAADLEKATNKEEAVAVLREIATDEARYWVMEARAGNCDAPAREQ